MGKYVNIDSKGNLIGTTFREKVDALVADGATKVDSPTEWKEGLVCVIDNGMFAAAGYAYNEREMQEFITSGPERPRQWLLYEHASELAKG